MRATLDRLLGGAATEEFEVVVVCNGCTDGTAEQARAHPYDVEVVETPTASKTAALNLGDRVATAFPRLYLDADVAVDTEVARALARNLGGPVLATAPELQIDTGRSPWAVRSYLRIWSRLPSVRFGLAGRGAFMLSEEGRRRFGEFPDVVADDYYIDCLYGSRDRRIVDEGASVVAAPRSLKDLLARKTRVFTGNGQLTAMVELTREGAPPGTTANRLAWLGVIRRSPARVVDLPVYLFVTLVAKRRARRRLARADYAWDRDESSRADRVDHHA